MNWITTNIRLPEDLYMDLKMQAARERKSVAAIVRQKLGKNPQQKMKKQSPDQILKQLQKIRKRFAKENKGLNLTEKLIEMRYEQ